MRDDSFLGLSASGFHRIAYSAWGDPNPDRAVICVHGLSRNRHDFDSLAEALAENGCYVVCPDIVGRGDSDWLTDPAGYGYPLYMTDMVAMIAHLGVAKVDWVGTSMGGLIGMMLAAQPKTPLRRLVMNDIGPFIPKSGAERIKTYLGKDPVFANFAAAEAYLRKTLAPFGSLSKSQWRKLTEDSIAARDGGFRLKYDPAIAEPFKEARSEDVDLWPLWNAVTCPVMALRGKETDLLPADTAQEMTRRGPQAKLVEFAGCGHAPALMDQEQIGVVRDWLHRS